jgi:hypothetical protein
MLRIDIINDTSPATPPTNVTVFEIIPKGFSWVAWDLSPESQNLTTARWNFFEDIRDVKINCIVKAPIVTGTYYFAGFVEVDGLKIAYLGDNEIVVVTLPVGGTSFPISVPIDKSGLLAPYIGFASTIIVATVATAIYVKRVKRRKEK